MTMTSFCANCGVPLAPGARFCDACGTPVAAAPAASAPPPPPPPSYQPPPPPPTVAPAGAFCPSCGAANAPGARFCNTCGANMTGQAPAQPAAAPQYAAPGAPIAPRAAGAKVSGAWWLMPIFLTWVGGLIAFIAVRKRNSGMATAMLIFSIVWFIVLFLLFRGC